ncbi:MAG: CDP-diacylglycerol--serine O-phosphatidyltransferase [Deltaproteobacteria bacterium]|nr:CDP-diacylglycerol--serine O-phosphatidyltransferase [Deltaproteobacteria bacterium]MBW1951652.1 CDP-diacylglycerol--serine O-phosphatidyltransferase [Deltaproteobacteria bacterium]MBW1985752.1 CDP-diacylglycerol--serine O-phosphatidyltransferase [Deltaproteobacteria bacterium]MBW2134665.1 CDP-diacylglycerol--serine O-phosphatidyltransferase [Deltaproteobacteria bacterium]
MKKRRKKNKGRNKFRGIYILPNLLTTASLFSGFYAIIAAINGRFEAAALAILVSLVLDGLDGRVARMTKSASNFGLQYDSLADLVAFGVAPGLLVYLWALQPYGRFGWVAAFLFVVCGALRLARFNVQIGSIDPRYFNGLPIPAAATMVATTILFYYHIGEWAPNRHIPILIMIYILSFLMVSNIKFYSFKKFELFKRKPFHVLVAAILIFIVVATEPFFMGFLLMTSYVISGPICTLLLLERRSTQKRDESEALEVKTSET